MNRYELMTRVNALMKLQGALTDSADAALPTSIAAKAGALLDDCWKELRASLNSYYEGQP